MKSKSSISKLARELGRSRSTIYREISRNQGKRGQMAGRQSIHYRDKIIEQRQRLGDFEADTLIGKKHKGAILTLLDRKSLYICTHRATWRQQTVFKNHCLLSVTVEAQPCLSVTFDNGKELSAHRCIQDVCIDTYFADPYHSNQRARNENTNGLIRQYLPKSSSFAAVTETQIQHIETALNNRPRKSLGWYTPSEVMADFYTVALAA